MSKREDLANAIVALLNDPANSFTVKFEAKLRTAPYIDRTELKTVGVTVLMGTKAAERDTRESFAHVYKPIIAVVKAIEGADEAARLAESSLIMTLVEEIEERFEEIAARETLAELAFMGFDEASGEQDAYDPELMKDGILATQIALEFQN